MFSRLAQFRCLWFGISALVVVLDQLTKWMVVATIPYGESVSIFPFFNLTLIYNTGAAFSFLSEAQGWQRWMFVGIALVTSLVLFIWLLRVADKNRLLSLALALILGGAIGNLWDRLYLGYVVDFFDVYYKTWHWPAFNIADSAIMLGAFFIIIDLFFSKEAAKSHLA